MRGDGAVAAAHLFHQRVRRGEQQQARAVHGQIRVGGVADGHADRASHQGGQARDAAQRGVVACHHDGVRCVVVRQHEQGLAVALHGVTGAGDEHVDAAFAERRHAVGGVDHGEAHAHAQPIGQQARQRRLEAGRAIRRELPEGRVVAACADAELAAADDLHQRVARLRALHGQVGADAREHRIELRHGLGRGRSGRGQQHGGHQ